MEESEAEIQSWFERQCEGDGILGHICNRDAVLQALAQSVKQELPFSLAQALRQQLLRSAHFVLEKLEHAGLVACNENISIFQDDILKPDLVLMDRESGTIIVIELKKSHQTARQAMTELIAYGQAIEQLYPSAQIAFVLVAPDWRPLLDYAVLNHVATGRKKMLALEVAPLGPAGFSLKVRVDALTREMRDLTIHPKSLPAETISYERRKATWTRYCPIEVTRALSTIAREGDRSGGTGFALLWRSRGDHGYQWHITVMALNPFALINAPAAESRRWGHPIAAYLRGEPRPNRASNPPILATDSDEVDPIPWSSWSEEPDPGAAMALIDEVYTDARDTLITSHDNQRHWQYVQADPHHGAGAYFGFEAWGLVGEMVRHNAKRRNPLDDLVAQIFTKPPDWQIPAANWVPCVDIFTGNDPLRDELLTVSSCYWLGVTFGTWLVCAPWRPTEYDGLMNVRFAMANARVIAAIRKTDAIGRSVPRLCGSVPRVRMEGVTPDYICVEKLVGWLYDHFFPDSVLQFAFELGLRAGESEPYGPGAVRSEVSAKLVRQANEMLQSIRTQRAAIASGEWRSEAEWKLEELLHGNAITANDLFNPTLRKHLVEAATPYFTQLRHPSHMSSPQVDV